MYIYIYIYIYIHTYIYSFYFNNSICDQIIQKYDHPHDNVMHLTQFNHAGKAIIKLLVYLDLLNAIRPPFCTLTTQSWLNWIDEED